MPQAQTPYHTSDDEIVLTKRDLGGLSFAGMRIGTARIEGKLWLREWDLIDALDWPCDEAPALFARLTRQDCRLVVFGRGESAEEQGCFVSIRGAMAMAVACPGVAIPGSAAIGFLQFLIDLTAKQTRRRRQSAPVVVRRYGHLAVVEGGRV
jgi:hypothetical protein